MLVDLSKGQIGEDTAELLGSLLVSRIGRVVDLYQGDLLTGCDEDWCLCERERFRDAREEWETEGGRRMEVSRWNDLRMRQWPGQQLALYRVIERDANGQPRYQRPLWLIFVPLAPEKELPTPREAQAIYEERFKIEHSIRFSSTIWA